MNVAMSLSVVIVLFAAVLIARGRALPAPPAHPFADEKAERQSADMNEVGPEEDWKLLTRLTKTQSYDPADSDKTKELLKEIGEFSRLAATADNVTDIPDDYSTTEDSSSITETDFASSDWLGSTWRAQHHRSGDDDELSAGKQEDDGNVEDIVKKISNDLKKLYTKIKQAIRVMKNWVNSVKGSATEFDEPYPMTASASESDGVFVIADPLIGDVDKSNKYTVPINAD